MVSREVKETASDQPNTNISPMTGAKVPTPSHNLRNVVTFFNIKNLRVQYFDSQNATLHQQKGRKK